MDFTLTFEQVAARVQSDAVSHWDVRRPRDELTFATGRLLLPEARLQAEGNQADPARPS